MELAIPFEGVTVRQIFLDNAAVVLEALRDRRVAAAWDEPSVLEEQTVGSLAGHLARGGVWAVEDYLDAGTPDGPVRFETAAGYFAALSDHATPDDHAAIRHRSATVAEVGHDALVVEVARRLDGLRVRLPDEPADRLLSVIGGAVMRLDDYLGTRLVEQVVHLDDLARSIGADPWPTEPDAAALVVACGAEIGRLRFGGPAMLRALFRGESGSLPVM